MLRVGLTLEVGDLVNGYFEYWDEFDMETGGPEEWSIDTVHDLLTNPSCNGHNAAQLKFWFSGVKNNGFLVASFKRVKLKGKGETWVLTE